MVKNLCIINSDDDLEIILKGIELLKRNKKRAILLMGGNYEEVKMETKKAIVTFMTSMPKDSAQTEKVSIVETAQTKEVQIEQVKEAKQLA